jgi:hypothetical protein
MFPIPISEGKEELLLVSPMSHDWWGSLLRPRVPQPFTCLVKCAYVKRRVGGSEGMQVYGHTCSIPSMIEGFPSQALSVYQQELSARSAETFLAQEVKT